jgi:serine/threonine protein kinase
VHTGRKADIWSLGCTVLEMLSGKHPWPDIDNQFAVMLAIHNATAGPPRPPGLSPLANDFLDHCFRVSVWDAVVQLVLYSVAVLRVRCRVLVAC